MATTPNFVKTSLIGFARPTAANTQSDGTGTEGVDIFTLATGGSGDGSRIDVIKVVNSQNGYTASTALSVRLFITDTSGLNPRIYDEITIAAATRTASAVGSSNLVNYPGGIWLSTGQKLQVTTSVFATASQVDIIARGGNFG